AGRPVIAVGRRAGLAARPRIAGLHSVTRVPVVAGERRPGLTLPGRDVAGLRPVADIAIVALRARAAPARDRIVVTARGRVAGVGRAHDPVVTVERSAGDALARCRVTGLGAVTGVAVIAVLENVVTRVGRQVASVGRAGVAVVAVRVGVAAARNRLESAGPRRGRAAVDRTDVPVIADGRHPVHAGPGRDVAGLDAVARIAIVALRVRAAAAGDRRVRAHVGRRIADIARAHYPVVTGRGRAVHAGPAV